MTSTARIGAIFLGILVCLALILSGCDSASPDNALGADGQSLAGGEGQDDGDCGEDCDEDEDGDGEVDPCDGEPSTEPVDSVIVADGDTCTLRGTEVVNDVFVGLGAILEAYGVAVGGQLEAVGATAVAIVDGSEITENVILRESGSVKVRESFIGADLRLADNTGIVEATSNTVARNLQVSGNTGGVALNNNVIGDSLQCASNNPAPTGSGNTAPNKEGQCQNL